MYPYFQGCRTFFDYDINHNSVINIPAGTSIVVYTACHPLPDDEHDLYTVHTGPKQILVKNLVYF
jgi:hypothetical protein